MWKAASTPTPWSATALWVPTRHEALLVAFRATPTHWDPSTAPHRALSLCSRAYERLEGLRHSRLYRWLEGCVNSIISFHLYSLECLGLSSGGPAAASRGSAGVCVVGAWCGGGSTTWVAQTFKTIQGMRRICSLLLLYFSSSV